jgi:hypothetical protein
MNIIELPGNLGILLSVPTLYAPDFSLGSSCAANPERLLEIIPYRTEERGGVAAYLWFILLQLSAEKTQQLPAGKTQLLLAGKIGGHITLFLPLAT